MSLYWIHEQLSPNFKTKGNAIGNELQIVIFSGIFKRNVLVVIRFTSKPISRANGIQLDSNISIITGCGKPDRKTDKNVWGTN